MIVRDKREHTLLADTEAWSTVIGEEPWWESLGWIVRTDWKKRVLLRRGQRVLCGSKSFIVFTDLPFSKDALSMFKNQEKRA